MGKLHQTFPLGNFEREWAGLKIKEYYLGELVSLACANGQEKTFAATFKKAFGNPLPVPQTMNSINGGYAFWTGQGQYMFMLEGDNIDADKDAAETFGDTAYACLQSDGWASLDLIGERAFDVLERFIPLDLRSAPKHFAARTSAHHIAVIVLKFSDTEIQLMTPRSSAQSFLDALTHVADNVLN